MGKEGREEKEINKGEIVRLANKKFGQLELSPAGIFGIEHATVTSTPSPVSHWLKDDPKPVVGIHSWHFWLAASMGRASVRGQRKFPGRDEFPAVTT